MQTIGKGLRIKIIAALILSAPACNNFGLLDKIENPGGSEKFTNNYYVFASSWTTMGDMAGGPYPECTANYVGPARADCACTKAAAKNGLRKHSNHAFRAYLGMTGTPTMEARCRVSGQPSSCLPNIPGPWFNADGAIVVNNFISNAGTIDGPILFTENRVALTAADQVWTGASATGTHQNECLGWNDTTATNINVGDPTATGTGWHNGGTSNCNVPKRVYCFATP